MIEKFEFDDWESSWSGKWSLLSFFSWGKLYTKKDFSDLVGVFLPRAIITYYNGNSTAYYREADKKDFANHIVKKVEKDNAIIPKLCSDLKSATDEVVEFVDSHLKKELVWKDYQKYQETVAEYYVSHNSLKYLVDYLPKDLLEKYFSQIQEARKYSEPAFDKTVEFMKYFSQQKNFSYSEELIRAMTDEELEEFFSTEKLPQKDILEERHQACACIFSEEKGEIIVGKELQELEKVLIGKQEKDLLKGTTAFPGKVEGKVHLVIDPKTVKDFQEGEILVAGMTRPDYLHLIKKAGAIVTDAGGMLCHAAISAREMKKPCVIGTQVATKVLNDGDLVEVDADKGIVKIIK